jgi:phosphatidylglycerol---prolipoprotein diacylglyceryl transferase
MIPIDVVAAGWYNIFYSLAVALAAAAMYLAGRQRGLDGPSLLSAIAVWVAGGIVGATIPGLLLGDLAATRTSLGAIAGATIALVVTARRLHVPGAVALDATAIAIPLGGAVVRIGCFLAECCQGTLTKLPIGVALHADDAARHPVQLYEASLEAALAFVLMRRPSTRPGAAFISSVGWIAAIRFGTEFFRDNEKLGPMSLAQWVVLPVAVACFAIVFLPWNWTLPRVRPAKIPSVALLVVAVACMGVSMTGALPQLEAAALLLTGLLLVAYGAHRFRPAMPAGIGMLALQMPVLSADSTFPRTYQSIGGGITTGSYDFRHEVSTGGCDEPQQREVWTRHHRFTGISLEGSWREQKSMTRAVGLRGRGYFDTEEVGAAVVSEGTPAQPGAYTRHSAGVSLAGDADWKYLGLSLGMSVGQFYPMEGSLEYPQTDPPAALSSFASFGMRVGPLNGLSLETRIADETPSWIPAPLVTVAVGLGDKRGNRIRVGISEAGYFVAGRHFTESGMEVSPTINVGRRARAEEQLQNAIQGGVMIRKWVRGVPPHPSGR